MTKAVVFPEPEQVELWDLPSPEVGPRQILLQTCYSSISPGTELQVLSGRLPLIQRGEVRYPLVPGYENVSRVVKVGEGVVGFRTGDWVCCEGASTIEGATSCWGGHVEYVVADPEQVFLLPPGTCPEHGVFMVLTAIALHGVQRAGVTLGDTVAIFGQGVIGLLATQIACLAGADRIIAVDLLEKRLEVARLLGADEVLVATEGDPVERIVELTGGQGADIVIEVTGSVRAAKEEVRACRERGRFVLLGMYPEPLTFDYWDLYAREIDILPSRGAGPKEHLPAPYYRWTWRRTYEETLRLIASERIRVAPLITDRLPIERIAEGYKALRESPEHTLKIILEW